MTKRKSPKERKKEREQQKQRGQQTIIVGVVAVIAIFGAIIFALSSVPAEAPIPDYLDRYDNFMSDTTDEGYARLGNPNAPVTVSEYSSFSCPGCLDFHDSAFSQLLPRIAAGEINFVYIPLQTGSIPNPEGAARTAICAGEQGQFWEMHDVLFFWHETYSNSAFQDGRIRTGVQELGLDTGEFNRCFNSNDTSGVLNAALSEGVSNTPTIQVNGAPVAADITSINNSIDGILPANGAFESGLIDDMTDDEPMTDEAEATEEPMDDMSEATEEAMDDETEMTEEAPMDDDEAEATEASE